MNVDEALRRIDADEEFPREAMEWALAHWDDSSPRFISRLRAAAAKGKVAPEAASEIFYIVHLCGDRGEALAYEPLCRLIGADGQIEDWLGDANVETLPGVLIKIYDGDTQPLIAAIASPTGDVYAKASALLALGWLAVEKSALSREDMRSLMRDLSRNPALMPHEVFWDVWASLAAHFGFGEFRSEVARQNRLGHLDGKAFDVREFDAILERVRRDPTDRIEFERFGARPFADAIGTLERWGDGGDDEASDEDGHAGAAPDAPYVNPLREIGRNDPCPCGSGKKYKKCCLAA